MESKTQIKRGNNSCLCSSSSSIKASFFLSLKWVIITFQVQLTYTCTLHLLPFIYNSFLGWSDVYYLHTLLCGRSVIRELKPEGFYGYVCAA